MQNKKLGVFLVTLHKRNGDIINIKSKDAKAFLNQKIIK